LGLLSVRSLAALLLLTSSFAHAGEPLDLRYGIDLRAVATDSTPSFVHGGLGRTRFDEEHDGLQWGAAYLAARYRLSDTLTLRADAVSFADGNGAGADITQAYLQYRPFPSGPIRFSGRLGAFYPEFSMEHRGPAWTPVYTVTPSALNSWYGEELRAIGFEGEARWLGASAGYQGDVALIAGVYGWNDPIGVILAQRGWGAHDRQTGLFGYLPEPGEPQTEIHEFREIDGRPGYYVGVNWRHGNRFELRAFHYDNRADPGAFENVYAWLTRFTTVGVRFEAGEHWTLIAQALVGETYVGPQATWGKVWDMDAWFTLASYERGRWRWSARYDSFSTEQTKGFGAPLSDDDGDAYTLSAQWSFTRQWSVALEWLRIDSMFGRRASFGLDADQSERQVQLAVRYQGHW
jgi:hypothetical protein